MKIVFASNYLQHHQMPFCEAMYSEIGDDFTFIQTRKPTDGYLKQGYVLHENEPYQINSYKSSDEYSKAYQKALDADALIITYFDEEIVKQRLKQNKLTFRYSERLFKLGKWRILDPRVFILYFKSHFRYRNKNLHMLCASAYTAPDCKFIFSYPNKRYKWGYFPPLNTYDVDELLKNKEDSGVNILWCARFLKLKHPEKAIMVARKLKAENYNFKLRMIGIGEKQEEIRKMISDYSLDDCVELLGSMSFNEVRTYMEKANIFLFTSDRNEGWGAVLNESMNSGCAVVANKAIGSAPFLIKDNYSGLIYNNNDNNDLYNKVKLLMDSKPLRYQLGKNAYNTLQCEWNAEVAATRFINLVEELTAHGECNLFTSGPCSKA